MFPRLTYSFIVWLTVLLLPSGLFAEELPEALKWEKRVEEINAKPGDKESMVVYSFINQSDKPVEVLDVRTSCGCTTVNAARKSYQPKESGTIEVRFTFGSRKGKQEKTIVVQTSERPGKQYQLTLRVNIPDTVRINKEKLSWEVGDPVEPQSFEITSLEPTTTKIKGIKTMGSAFTAALEEVESGKQFRVKVTPVTTENATRGTIRLEVGEGDKVRTIYLPVVIE